MTTDPTEPEGSAPPSDVAATDPAGSTGGSDGHTLMQPEPATDPDSTGIEADSRDGGSRLRGGSSSPTTLPLPCSSLAQIDQVCDRFEAAWAKGLRPKHRGVPRRRDRAGAVGPAPRAAAVGVGMPPAARRAAHRRGVSGAVPGVGSPRRRALRRGAADGSEKAPGAGSTVDYFHGEPCTAAWPLREPRSSTPAAGSARSTGPRIARSAARWRSSGSATGRRGRTGSWPRPRSRASSSIRGSSRCTTWVPTRRGGRSTS